MKVLLLGQHGQVSQELQRTLQGTSELTVLGHVQLDLAQPERIRQHVLRLRRVVRQPRDPAWRIGAAWRFAPVSEG